MPESTGKGGIKKWFELPPDDYLEAISHVTKRDINDVPFDRFGLKIEELLSEGKITPEQAKKAFDHINSLKPKL